MKGLAKYYCYTLLGTSHLFTHTHTCTHTRTPLPTHTHTQNDSMHWLAVHTIPIIIAIICHTYIHSHTSTPTHHGLYHESPSASHFNHKLINIQVVFLLQSLHHCINGNESTSTTNTSTCREKSLQKMYYKVILHHFILHNTIVVTFIDNSDMFSCFLQPCRALRTHVSFENQLCYCLYQCFVWRSQPTNPKTQHKVVHLIMNYPSFHSKCTS